MKKFLPKNGFTLIELLVVITIIAFLAVIGIVSFTAVQAQARDGRRRADIDAIATAFESNRNQTLGTYPAYDTTIFANATKPCDPIDQTPLTCGSTTLAGTVSSAGTYLTYGSISSDIGYYINVVSTSPSSYLSCARLEKGNGNSGSHTVFNSTAPLNWYCRASQQ